MHPCACPHDASLPATSRRHRDVFHFILTSLHIPQIQAFEGTERMEESLQKRDVGSMGVEHIHTPQDSPDKCATTGVGKVKKVSCICDRAFPHGHLRVCWVSQGSVCMGGSSRIPASWGTAVPRAGLSCVEVLCLLFRTSLLKTAQGE